MVRYAAAQLTAANPDKFAMSRGEYLPTHFKNMREVAAALTGMQLQKAFTYLSDVKEHKQVIPFRRFAGGIGRASQAKQFKFTKGALLWIGRYLAERGEGVESRCSRLDAWIKGRRGKERRARHESAPSCRISPDGVSRLYTNVSCDPGRWPEKSVRHILNLLKNAESNADAKDLDKEELVIKNINVNQAPVRQAVSYLCDTP
jgi:ribosomal protein L22